jgi:hypothetical protein
MAIIPNDEQFIGLSPTVNTTERRSALINAESQAYTMQDITDTVSAGLPPATNPTVNYLPTNWLGEFADSPIGLGIAPAGYFGWGTLRTRVGGLISPPVGVDQTNIAPFLPQYGLSIINTSFTGAKTVIGDYANIAGGNPMRLNLETPVSGPPRMYVDSAQDIGQWDVFEVNYQGSKIRLGQAYTFNDTNIANGILADATISLLKLNNGIASPFDGIFSADGLTGITRVGPGDSAGIGVNVLLNSILVGSGLMFALPPVDPVNAAQWVKVTDESGNTFKLALYQ